MWDYMRSGKSIDSHSCFIWKSVENYYIYSLDSSMNGHLNIINWSVKRDSV